MSFLWKYFWKKKKEKPVEEWRRMNWNEKHELEQKMRNFKVSNPDLEQVRILMTGPVGAGKSSFITSVNNVFQGRITCEALVDTASVKNFTREYKSHYIEGKDGKPLAFLFNDIMGLEAEAGSGAHEDDVIKALQGFVQEGYRFCPQSPMSEDDPRYKSNPELKDQISCLVYVLPADKVSIMDPKLFEKMRRIREKATELNLPQVIIMTKPEEICPRVKGSLRKIYTSKRIKEKMLECSNLLGVPMNHIFPVKNYQEEMDTDNDTDVLILKALDQIVSITNDSSKKRRPDSSFRCEESSLRYEAYPAFIDEWRRMQWDEKHELEQKLRNFSVSNPDVQQVRILMMGPVGSGKSSFITSVNNVFQRRITSEALVDTASGKSFTKVYKSHYIEGEDGRPLAFLFNDIMGLEAEAGRGAHEDDVIKALQGFIQEGYRFHPQSPMSEGDPRYRSNPELQHQIFCLVYVLPADKVSIMDLKVFEKMRRIREKATELNLPQVIIMTKPEEVCFLIKKDLRKIYTSKRVKEKMQECSNLLGVPMNHIFPVKNYHEEMDTDNDTDVLILKALDQIVNIANDLSKKRRPGSRDSYE